MRTRERKSVIIAFIGVVGSGKTTIARLLAKRLQAVHIRTDAIRGALARRGQPISRAIRLSDQRRDRVLAAGRSVILDFDTVNPQRQREIAAVAQRFGTRLYFIHVRAPETVILERLRRKRYPIPGVFKSFRHALLAYYSRRRFHRRRLRARPLFAIDTTRPLQPQVERIIRRIQGL